MDANGIQPGTRAYARGRRAAPMDDLQNQRGTAPARSSGRWAKERRRFTGSVRGAARRGAALPNKRTPLPSQPSPIIHPLPSSSPAFVPRGRASRGSSCSHWTPSASGSGCCAAQVLSNFVASSTRVSGLRRLRLRGKGRPRNLLRLPCHGAPAPGAFSELSRAGVSVTVCQAARAGSRRRERRGVARRCERVLRRSPRRKRGGRARSRVATGRVAARGARARAILYI
mmetsp:Transcript_39328/g.106211  ORF Transcript_39328/g.106211 Transcript_39328/m.106211 type:complete len:228 (-) Transcript_39328:185-868(-)